MIVKSWKKCVERYMVNYWEKILLGKGTWLGGG